MKKILIFALLYALCSPVYSQISIDDNGIIRCLGVSIGTTQTIFGDTYEVVDRDLLIQRRDEGVEMRLMCVSNVTDMSEMFLGLPFNEPIINWDVSSVTNMSGMFFNTSFNQPIGGWDVSSVTNMSNLFRGSPFNQPIGEWDVSSVTSMSGIFALSSFNQPISDWDVSSVTQMRHMFAVSPFNQPIGNWDVSLVTTMSGMFSSYSHFNQPIGDWDVSSVTNMYAMFYESRFNHPIGNWDVSSVTDMSLMFVRSQFNQPIGDWDVSSVTDMHWMFNQSPFNHPIGDWDVSSVTNMAGMFGDKLFVEAVVEFNQPIGDWDVSSVTNMDAMFFLSKFNQPIGDWDVSSVTNMNQLFTASPFNQPIGDWDVSSVTNMSQMFRGTPFNHPVGDWDVSSVRNMRWMFSNSPFNQHIWNWDVSSVTDMAQMFESSQFNQPISFWCVPNILSEPNNFSTGSPLTAENKPIWGTCPGNPPKPNLLFPSNNSVDISRTVEMFWSSDTLSTKYHLQVFEGFDPVVVDTFVTQNSFIQTIPFDEFQEYNWRVRGINENRVLDGEPLVSEWSAVWKFTTGSGLVGIVTLATPEDNSANVPVHPTFKWVKEQNSQSYRFQISEDNFQTVLHDHVVSDTSYTLQIDLLYLTEYQWRVKGSNFIGDGEWSSIWSFSTMVDTSIKPEEVPTNFTLNQNYPNPFNPSTQIGFSVPEPTHVRLEVYTITGQLVSVLVNDTIDTGIHNITFSARNISSGVYIYRLTTHGFTKSKMMTLVK